MASMDSAAARAAAGDTLGAQKALNATPPYDLTSEANRQLVRELYPTAYGDMPLDLRALAEQAAEAASAVPVITAEQVEAYVRGRPKLSAGGRSQWTYRLLLRLNTLASPRSNQLWECVADIINDIITGKFQVGGNVWAELTARRGVALTKADGRPRPVGIGEIFMRMAAALLRKQVAAKIAEAVGVHEYASGRSGGVEAVAHTVRCHADHGELVVQTDFKNAFGTVSRQAVLAATQKFVPELLPLVLFMYGQPTPTIFGGSRGQPELRVMQEEGVIQGCPLGGDLFAI
jgi:hypothetical protein